MPDPSPFGPTPMAAQQPALPKPSPIVLVAGIAILVIIVITVIGYFIVPAFTPTPAAPAADTYAAPGDVADASASAVAPVANPLDTAPVNPFDTSATPATNPFNQ